MSLQNNYLHIFLQIFSFFCLGSVMNEDLEPFEKTGGITKDQFDKSRGRGTHYQIIGHRLYREDDCMFPFRLAVNFALFYISIFRLCVIFSSFWFSSFCVLYGFWWHQLRQSSTWACANCHCTSRMLRCQDYLMLKAYIMLVVFCVLSILYSVLYSQWCDIENTLLWACDFSWLLF